MKKTSLALAVAAAYLGRAVTCDVAIGYRMGAGYPGDVNRTHPFSVEPGLMDATNPIAAYGNAALINTAANSFRGLIASDTAVTKIAGVLVRPYPTQQQSGGMSASLGSATPPTSGVVDVLRTGYAMVKVPAGTSPTKGGAVYVWVAASTGSHVQGGFETAASAGNTAAIANAYFNGPADANGNYEIMVFAQ